MKDVIPLLRSKLKIAILVALTKESLTPLMLSKIIKHPRPSISRVILELEKDGLVKCLNPKADRWREYIIITKGKAALVALKRFT